jgi:hypothetical protein
MSNNFKDELDRQAECEGRAIHTMNLNRVHNCNRRSKCMLPQFAPQIISTRRWDAILHRVISDELNNKFRL